jgi:hypothetical protein
MELDRSLGREMALEESAESRDFVINYRLNRDNGLLREEGIYGAASETVQVVSVSFEDGMWRTAASREPGIS